MSFKSTPKQQSAAIRIAFGVLVPRCEHVGNLLKKLFVRCFGIVRNRESPERKLAIQINGLRLPESFHLFTYDLLCPYLPIIPLGPANAVKRVRFASMNCYA